MRCAGWDAQEKGTTDEKRSTRSLVGGWHALADGHTPLDIFAHESHSPG